MTAIARTSGETGQLGRRTGALTPGTRSSLRTATVAAILLAPAVIALSHAGRPWGVTLLAVVLGGLGLLLGAAAVIELLPTPGRITFHEHGFADARPDHTTDLYLDGQTVVHTVPSGDSTSSAHARRTSPRSFIATR